MFHLLISLAFAGAVGVLAGRIMGFDNPWYRDILLGLVGGAVGSLVFGLLGISSTNIIGRLILSTLGACLVVILARKFGK